MITVLEWSTEFSRITRVLYFRELFQYSHSQGSVEYISGAFLQLHIYGSIDEISKKRNPKSPYTLRTVDPYLEPYTLKPPFSVCSI